MKIHLPEALAPYVKQAESLLAQRAVAEIEFSGPTYQVHVIDKEAREDVWTFIQLDPHGRLIDRFCSCEESAETTSCAHLAASYLTIFNHQPLPLHARFESSLWNYLCRLYAEKIGYENDLLKPNEKGRYGYSSVSGKRLFSVTGKTPQAKQKLEDLIERRRRETEETSLKFSNLSEKELMLWREGRPSVRLLYELSFWSDLAKWLMMMQERGDPYALSFGWAANHLPNSLTVDFPELTIEFYLAQTNLEELIPFLSTVKSPLMVHGTETPIERLTYEPNKSKLHIQRAKVHQENQAAQPTSQNPVIQIGSWTYIPGDGFYPNEDEPLLSSSSLQGHDIEKLFNQYLPLVQQRLEGCSLHLESVEASYHLFFDSDWNLHIQGYLFQPGDLTQLPSRDFGEWVYLAGDGFYRLRDRRFSELEKIIPCSEVGDFVTEQRLWLASQPGFNPHVASLEVELTYVITPDQTLRFLNRSAIEEEAGRHKDFGPWIYFSGQGFFSKTTRIGSSTLLKPGTVVPEQNIPLFIRMLQDELQAVIGFFRKICPILSAGLTINLSDKGTILLAPQYEIRTEDQGKELQIYGEYVYVKGEGFHELPALCRLPERYTAPLEIDSDQFNLFLLEELPELQPLITQLDVRLQTPSQLQLTMNRLERLQKRGYEWFTISMHYQSEKGIVPVSDFWKAIAQKERFLFSSAGLIDLTNRHFDWLRALKPERIDVESNTITLSILELLRLHALENLQPATDSDPLTIECRELFERLMSLEEEEIPNLTGLTSELRSYQLTGVHWLWSLYKHRLSGLLCDDMGLGKTHQAMGLIAAVHNKCAEKSAQTRILVICPTSVIYHWQEKLAAYLPDAQVVSYYGIKRSLEGLHAPHVVLLTSYGLWRRDHEKLQNITFELAIFDEVQMAKTHTSRLHSVLLSIQATMRLGLSGTPIENRLRELKALFDIVLPSYMPTEKEYRELFLRPIEKEGDEARRALLRRFIHPFVLRRKKDEVLQDLPEKTEEIVHCQLSLQQQELYREALALGRPLIIDKLNEAASPIPYIHIFALLSRLKQICNHPAAYLKQVADYQSYHSGKWDLFVELLGEARASGQKVVVFSQYLTMLDIFEAYLKDHHIEHATIRGTTLDRGEQIKRFNREPKCEVFLGSLQAGGLGIDLTAASVVIHYDRWWNAARENQATDRVHRIGQTRGVQVFKLVTKGTFEERIDQLITTKGKLLDDIVGVDDQEALKRFERDELVQLLQDIESEIDEEEL